MKPLCCSRLWFVAATGVLALVAFFMVALTVQAQAPTDPNFRDPGRGFFGDDRLRSPATEPAPVTSLQAELPAQPSADNPPADFDGQSVYIQNVTSQSTACLEVKNGIVSNGQAVQVAACNDLTAQKWTVEKRTAGDYKDTYRLVSQLGDDTHCLDNGGVFAVSNTMYVSSCLNDTDSDAADQSVTLTASGDGYTVTFTKGSSSVWLNTSRIPHIPSGGANQIPVGDTIGSGSVWQFTSVPTPPPTDDDDDFDGQTLYVWHETDDSEGCLDVKHGNRTNGQDVQTWDCNKSDAQKWIFEKRAAGDYQGSYRLVSALGSDTHCLDNRGDFATGERMGIWQCVGDTNGAASNQSVTIAESGEGYTITFVRNSDSKSVWLVTDRTSTNPKGGANQTTVTDTAPASAVWTISATAPSDTPANNPPANNPPANNPPANDPPPPPQVQNDDTDMFDDQIVQIYHVTTGSTGCLTVPEVNYGSYAGKAGAQLTTAACDDSAGQQWQIEKQTEDKYLLRSMLYSQVYCVDNDAQFSTSDRMGIETCAVNDNGHADNALEDQTVEIEAEGSGYTLTFTNSSNESSWLSTSRADNSASGPVGQTTVVVEDPVRASAIWGIGTADDRKAGRTNPALVKPADPYHGKVVKIKTRHSRGADAGWVAGCLYIVPDPAAGSKLLMSSHPLCHWHQVKTYDDFAASLSWRIERRALGDFAGSYRLVNMTGGQNLCADADVDDKYDSGNEFTTTPDTATAGMFVDTCVGDNHADVASQSVTITKLDDLGAWGKDTYTITFAESAADDAAEVYLSAKSLLGYAGQRVASTPVNEFSTLYIEEQSHDVPDRP